MIFRAIESTIVSGSICKEIGVNLMFVNLNINLECLMDYQSHSKLSIIASITVTEILLLRILSSDHILCFLWTKVPC